MSRTMSPRLAGRRSELAMLRQVHAEARAGQGRVVLVGGEAGLGKTRLAREFTTSLGGGSIALHGGCVEQSDAGLPLAPFTAILRHLIRARGAAFVAEAAGDETVTELARLLPALGPAPTVQDPDLARARLFEAVLSVCATVAEEHCLVLVVDDAHWADPASLELLSYLAEGLRSSAVMIVVTYRAEEVTSGHPVRARLVELARLDNVTSLDLPRLSLAEVTDQLAGIIGADPDPAAAAAAFRFGEGVPLLTEALVEPGGRVATEVPASVDELLLRRVRDLPVQAQHALRAAALGGAVVSEAVLAQVCALQPRALDEVLAPAVRARVLVADEEGYVFRHGLIRAALLKDLRPGERADLHVRYATTLEADLARGARGWLTPAVARHWFGAGVAEQALTWSWRAAREAGERFAFPEQLLMARQALTLWQDVETPEAMIGSDRAGVLEVAADAACWASDPVVGLAMVEEGLSSLDERQEPERVAGLLLQRASMRQQRLEAGELDDLRAALRLAPDPGQLHAELLGQYCRALMLHGQFTELPDLLDRLDRVTARLEDEKCGLEADIIRASLAARDGVDVSEELRRCIGRAERMGSTGLEVIAHLALTTALGDHGRHADAVEAGRAGMGRAMEVGQGRYAGAAFAQQLARSLTAAGRWDEALEVVTEALALDPSALGRSQLLLCEGRIASARGQVEAVHRALRELQAMPGPQGRLAREMTLAQLRLAVSRLEGRLDAEQEVTDALAGPDASQDTRTVWPFVTEAALYALDLPAERRAGLAAAVREASAGLDCPGPDEHAYRLTTEAAVDAAVDDGEPWQRAATAWRRLHRPYEEAQALVRSAGACAAGGNRAAAGEDLRRATTLAHALRAQPLVLRAEALARRARIALGEVSAPRQDPHGLTGRELEVLKLVAQGLSNGEIGRQLFISTKTASVHVSNILTKLRVSTRGQAAATAHREHLIDPD